jgi:hypothetical protein
MKQVSVPHVRWSVPLKMDFTTRSSLTLFRLRGTMTRQYPISDTYILSNRAVRPQALDPTHMRSYVIPVLGRALSILDVLQKSGSPLSVKEICRTTDYPKSTIYRIVRTFVAYGYVLHLLNGKYSINTNSARFANISELCTLQNAALETHSAQDPERSGTRNGPGQQCSSASHLTAATYAENGGSVT